MHAESMAAAAYTAMVGAMNIDMHMNMNTDTSLYICPFKTDVNIPLMSMFFTFQLMEMGFKQK